MSGYYRLEVGQDGNGRWHWRIRQVTPIPPNDTINPHTAPCGTGRTRRAVLRRGRRALAREERYARSWPEMWHQPVSGKR